jgi:hypothetical protein
LVDLARQNPNVKDVAIGSTSPLGSGPIVPFAVSEDEQRNGLLRAVGPGYFRTLGINMMQGREFAETDRFGSPRVAIVNESLARLVFGDVPAVGRMLELKPGAPAPWTRKPGRVLIVGVASNVKDVAMNEVEFPNIYLPFDQIPAPWVELIVRANGPIQNLGRHLAQEAARLDPLVPVNQPVPFDQRVGGALGSDRFNTFLVSAFAIAALALAAVGIYGTVAYNVQARTRELGVRLALGAEPSRLFAGALYQAGRLGIAGGLLGLGGALAIAVAIGDALYLVRGSHNGMLYGVTTTDPSTLATAFFSILAVTIAAAAIPARGVSRVDPISALKIN